MTGLVGVPCGLLEVSVRGAGRGETRVDDAGVIHPPALPWRGIRTFPPGHFHAVGHSPYHHHHAPILIKRYTINVYKTDSG